MPKTVHVLYVEDEPAHARLVERAFDSAAPDVMLSVAASLDEARAAIDESNPDLVIADFLLPDGRGTELLAIQREDAPFPVVVLTSHGDESVAVEAMKAGALDYVVKSDSSLIDLPHVAERALREWKLLTERRAMEAELIKNEARLSMALDAAGIGTWDWKIETDEIVWSDGVEDILGASLDSIGTRLQDYLHLIIPDHRDQVVENLKKSAETGDRYYAEYQVFSSNGEVRTIESRGQVFLNVSKAPDRMVGTVMNITERLKAEAAARDCAVARSKLDMLSPRENDVLNLVAAGEPNKAIAYRLDLSEKTVEKHRARLMKKLQVRSVAELMRIALAADR
jgi:PAS domain S-box-containing protein